MAEIESLVPKIKFKDMPANSTIRADNGEYVVTVQAKPEGTTVTIEYAGRGPGWAVVKIGDPDPDLMLSDLVLALKAMIRAVVEYGQDQPQAPQ
jgi:hypothetical protein